MIARHAPGASATPCVAATPRRRQPCVTAAAAAIAAASALRRRPRRRRLVATATAIVAPVTTFEDAGEWLARRAVSLAASLPGGRALVGITGPPGGGKSTLAALVRERADALLRQQQEPSSSSSSLAVILPMDGFHYTRAQLDAFPDPRAAHARRGAPHTFDADAFVAAVAQARAPSSPTTFRVPSFDHAVKDPVADAIEIPAEARVVFVEGNYLLLDEQPWAQLWRGGERGGGDPQAPLLDETWFVDAPLEAAMAHIFARQTSAGVGLSPEESRRRVEQNDAPNARLVVGCRARATVLVPGELPMRGEAASAA